MIIFLGQARAKRDAGPGSVSVSESSVCCDFVSSEVRHVPAVMNTFNINTQSDGGTTCEISFNSGIKTPGSHDDWSRGQGDNRGRGH